MRPENDEPGGAAKERQASPFAFLSPLWRRSSLALSLGDFHMSTTSSSLWRKGAHWLFDRRSLRAWWAYVLWILIYLFICALGHEDVLPSPAWLALIPVALVIAHMIRPTALGWLIILVPTLLYAGVGVYYLIADFTDKWTHDLGRLIFLAMFEGALLCTCAGLLVDGPWKRKIDHVA